MMWYARVERLGFVLRCFALGIEIRLCGDISVKTPATPGRRSVRLVLLIMMKEGMSCSRRCYSSYVLDTINNIWIKRSCPSWIFEAPPPFMLPAQMVSLCLKVALAAYYWCRSCNTLRRCWEAVLYSEIWCRAWKISSVLPAILGLWRIILPFIYCCPPQRVMAASVVKCRLCLRVGLSWSNTKTEEANDLVGAKKKQNRSLSWVSDKRRGENRLPQTDGRADGQTAMQGEHGNRCTAAFAPLLFWSKFHETIKKRAGMWKLRSLPPVLTPLSRSPPPPPSLRSRITKKRREASAAAMLLSPAQQAPTAVWNGKKKKPMPCNEFAPPLQYGAVDRFVEAGRVLLFSDRLVKTLVWCHEPFLPEGVTLMAAVLGRCDCVLD